MEGRGYWPSLDGVRAVAIAAVLAYHLGHLGGGWLGVDMFFVLSGFLITGQLLAAHSRPTGAALRAFWGRRARRLLPAVLVLVVALALYAWVGGPGVVPAQLRQPALATLAYVANWQQVAADHSYFQAFAAPDPLVHTWSLAIEEQFYLCWPLLLLLLVRVSRGRLRSLVAATTGLAVASAAWAVAAAQLWGANRAYLGTDTRAWELLLGAVVAMVLRDAGPVRRPRAWSAASLVATVGVAAGVAAASGTPPWVWDGGMVAIACGVAVVVAAAVRVPSGPVARALALPPVRWVGWISYSLYLWHWPVIVLMTPATTGLAGAPLLACRLALSLAAATASFYLVEQPLRRADWARWWRRALVPTAVAGAVGTVFVATVAPVAATTAKVATPSAPASLAGLAGQVAPVLPIARTVSAAEPVRFWLFGDSVLNDAAPGVTAALQATGDAKVVADTTFPGWSFAHDPQWRSQWQQVIATDHPEVALGTWSWDDQLAESDPRGYVAFLRQAMRVILTPGNGVDLLVLVQFPQAGPPASAYDGAPAPGGTAAWSAATRAQRSWDAAARTVAASFPGRAIYLPTDRLFDPGGRYLAWFKTPAGAWLRARKIDNTHFCPYGAASFGAYLTTLLSPMLHLGPMAPGWESGAWVRDPRYDDPPGACPADQPPPHYDGVHVPGLPATGGSRQARGAHRPAPGRSKGAQRGPA